MASSTDRTSDSHFPLAGLATDGWSTETEASATCFCGAVQLAFPTEGPGFLGSFVCNCTDCRKITASMFASNFSVADSHLRYVRGRDNLKTFAQSKTVAANNTMTNHFCSTCGTLMFRVGANYPGMSIMRIGTVDDFTLHETKLKPTSEHYTTTRVSWFSGVEGVKKYAGFNK